MNKTLDALAHALETGQTSARVLTEEALAKIAAPEGEGGRSFLAVDADGALAAADHIDLLRKCGAAPSRYAGIPISVKDLFDIAGQVTKAGSVILADDAPASSDAPAIARLKQAGFIAIGRTNMTEFAYSGVGLNPHYGTPRSVYDRKTGRIPGGSSSGAAVSVADGMVTAGIGSDTGGSCRVPAAFNGIVGFKSSTGRVPTLGAFPLSFSLDTVGPLANSVNCCAILDALMAQDWNGAVTPRAPGTIRLGLLRNVMFDDLDDAVADGFERARQRLEKAGVSFIEIDFPELETLPEINANGGISAVEAYSHHRDRMKQHGERYDPRVFSRINLGIKITAPDYVRLLRQRQAMIERADELMQGIDGFFSPTAPFIPPAITEADDDANYARLNYLCLRNTFIGNFLDRCAISLPVHEPGTAPVGAMITAPWGGDKALFSVAQTLEKILRL